MGFTPVDGLVMGTRCGDVDPGILTFIMNKEGLNASQLSDLINKNSGVLGISGVSSDMRELEAAANEGNTRAMLAMNVYFYRIKKYIGSYAAAMGGVDIVVFTGGVGENQCSMRKAVCQNMEYMGIKLDEAKNDDMRGREMVISTPDSKVTVIVVPTNEEYVIASDTQAILNN
jgi:acetate kinase